MHTKVNCLAFFYWSVGFLNIRITIISRKTFPKSFVWANIINILSNSLHVKIFHVKTGKTCYIDYVSKFFNFVLRIFILSSLHWDWSCVSSSIFKINAIILRKHAGFNLKLPLSNFFSSWSPKSDWLINAYNLPIVASALFLSSTALI